MKASRKKAALVIAAGLGYLGSYAPTQAQEIGTTTFARYAIQHLIKSSGFVCTEVARAFIPPISPKSLGIECESGYSKRYLFYIDDYGGRHVVRYIDSYIPDGRHR